MGNMQTPRWSPRVKREKIKLLYERDAKGLADIDLQEEVAFSIYARCLSILEVTEAVRGRVRCPQCETIICHSAKQETILVCSNCQWTMDWLEYKRSYKGKQLFGGGAVQAFVDYVRDFPKALSYSDRMYLIDRVIHECHKFPTNEGEEQLYTRPAAINLIEGRLEDIISLLEGLAYGEASVPGALERLGRWREIVGSAARAGYGRK